MRYPKVAPPATDALPGWGLLDCGPDVFSIQQGVVSDVPFISSTSSEGALSVPPSLLLERSVHSYDDEAI